MTPFTADELVVMVKARDLLRDKVTSGDNTNSYRVETAYGAVVDVLRHSYLDTKDEASK
jgi:hypothetical protein